MPRLQSALTAARSAYPRAAAGRSRCGLVAASGLLSAGVASVWAAPKLTPGQEFVYAGTERSAARGPLEWQWDFRVRLSALVTKADPGRGYEVVLTERRELKQKPGERKYPVQVQVTTVRYAPDLKPALPPGSVRPPVPLAPRAELKAGQEWRQSEAVPLLALSPALPVTYTVVRETKVDGRTCLEIEKKPAQPLPLIEHRQRGVGPTHELTDYGQTLCVDPVTGIVQSATTHAHARSTLAELYGSFEFADALSLVKARQLSPTDLAARIREANARLRAQKATARRLRSLDSGPAGARSERKHRLRRRR